MEAKEKLEKLLKKKKEHMDEYRKAVEGLANSRSDLPFRQGECDVCNELDPQIEELTNLINREKKLNRILKDDGDIG